MKEELISDFSCERTICRCCLTSSGTFSTFAEELIRMFTECTSIEISEDDGLPLSICERCVKNIQFCHDFVETCKSTDVALKNRRRNDPIFGTDSPESFEIKLEPSDVNEDSFPNYEDPVKSERNSDSEEENLRETRVKKKHKEKKKTYDCPVCEIPILGKTQFKIHLRDLHDDYKRYVCPHCKKGFSKSHYLNQHILIHSKMRPYACDLCPKTYKQKGNLYIHKKLHENKKPFSCEVCGESFKLKAILEKHSLLHENRADNLCDWCGASFAQVGNLRAHMRTHTGEKPFACSQCPFRCAVVSGLTRHKKIHENLKDYICNICKKGFNNSSSKVRHMKIHTGELPYKCEYCPKAFIDNWKRKMHMVKAHNLAMENIPKMIPGRKKTVQPIDHLENEMKDTKPPVS